MTDIVLAIAFANAVAIALIVSLVMFVRGYRSGTRHRLLRTAGLTDVLIYRKLFVRALSKARDRSDLCAEIRDIDQSVSAIADQLEELRFPPNDSVETVRRKCVTIVAVLRFPLLLIPTRELATDLETTYSPTPERMFDLFLQRELRRVYGIQQAIRVVAPTPGEDLLLLVRRLRMATSARLALAVFRYIIVAGQSPARDVALEERTRVRRDRRHDLLRIA